MLQYFTYIRGINFGHPPRAFNLLDASNLAAAASLAPPSMKTGVSVDRHQVFALPSTKAGVSVDGSKKMLPGAKPDSR